MNLLKTGLLLLTLTSLSACNLVNHVKMRYANDDIVPVWTKQNSTTALNAFYLEEDKPFVEVSINGVEGFRFMIDTGASLSYVIDTAKVKALNLEQGYSLSVGGWGDGEDSTLFQTQVDKLSLAEVQFSDVNMAYLMASKTQYFSRPEEATFDGVLGHDLLHHFSWTLDKKRNHIQISRQAYKPDGTENSIPFDVFFSKISVPVSVDFGNGQRLKEDFLVDTGSRNYAKFSAAYVNNNIKLTGTQITGADFGLSGKTEHQRTSIPEITLGEQTFEWVKVNLIGPDDDEDDNWIIGSGILNQYVTIIDYPTSTLYIRTDSEGTYKSDYNLIGLELRKLTSGNFIVRYVLPDMAAATSDFAPGDEIQSINGVPATEISLVEWLRISAEPGEYELCRMREELNCLAVRSEHISGYSMP